VSVFGVTNTAVVHSSYCDVPVGRRLSSPSLHMRADRKWRTLLIR